MTLLRLVRSYGIRKGIALWLLPELMPEVTAEMLRVMTPGDTETFAR